MSKRILSVLLGVGLLAGGASAAPAQAVTKVPDKVQIEDPLNDANFLNDQDNAYGTPAAGEGDHTGPADVGSVSDFLKVWFTNTKKTVSVHILTERPPPASTTIYYRVAASPGEGKVATDTTRGCLNWRMIFGGKQSTPGAGPVTPQTLDISTYRSADGTSGVNHFEFEDACNTGAPVEVETVTVETLEDATGITTMTVPRSASPLLGRGGKITSPYAIARLVAGQKGQELPTGGSFFSGGTGDTTKRGAEYLLVDKKRKADPCKKRPKPKKCTKPRPPKPPKPPKPSKKCPAFEPGEIGADAETVVVKDSATEAKPVEVVLETGPGLGTGSPGSIEGQPIPTDALMSHAYQNIQVDPKAKSTGLWVRAETPDNSDYDLFLYNPDGTEAAHAAGFNPEPAISDGTGNGGHTEANAEQLDGIASADCQGFTADLSNATGFGGEVTLKLWLGDANYTPPAPTETGSEGWAQVERYF